MHIVVIWQRLLPYHIARLSHAKKRLSQCGHRLTAVEVAASDQSYSFIPVMTNGEFDRVCCFPCMSYHKQNAGAVHRKVLQILESLQPDVVFAPATAFPEGMASLVYRLKSRATAIVMDDAWQHTDQKGALTRAVKKLIHGNADAAFVPAISHRDYYMQLGFPADRILFGVDVVDNDYFSVRVDKARRDDPRIRLKRKLPVNYFLFVGRFLPRKGLETLLTAYKLYRERMALGYWDLVLIGEGDYLETLSPDIKAQAAVHYAGGQFGDDLCEYYGLARALVVPSETDPWALVVNEALASALPVIVSKGCGAAMTLVKESQNGWTFEPGNAEELSLLLHRLTQLSTAALLTMSNKSREIISAWSLDRFADGIEEGVRISRRSSAGLLADVTTKLWKGRVRIV